MFFFFAYYHVSLFFSNYFLCLSFLLIDSKNNERVREIAERLAGRETARRGKVEAPLQHEPSSSKKSRDIRRSNDTICMCVFFFSHLQKELFTLSFSLEKKKSQVYLSLEAASSSWTLEFFHMSRNRVWKFLFFLTSDIYRFLIFVLLISSKDGFWNSNKFLLYGTKAKLDSRHYFFFRIFGNNSFSLQK